MKYLIGILFLCAVQTLAAQKNDGKINVTFLQINDVYEIYPLDSGRSGGLARVATVRKQLERQNPNTFMLLAGDFVSPSATGTLRYDDTRLAGRQMVDVLNVTGLNLATFGNHEFDNSQVDLQKCIDISRFNWVNANARPRFASGYLLRKPDSEQREELPPVFIKKFTDADGTSVRVGFFGLTLETSAGKTYIHYDDYLVAAGKAIEQLKGKCEFIIALTHLSIGQDIALAKKYPQIKMIIGGHEHVHSDTTIGKVRILKADANVKSVYKHFIVFDTRLKKFGVRSELQYINSSIPSDPDVQAVVDQWNAKATTLLRAQSDPNPCRVVSTLPLTFDGTEASVRTQPTLLTTAIAKAMVKAARDSGYHVDCALYNSGSIRLDDSLKASITFYDLFRVLPFGGYCRVDTLRGSVISRLLDTSFNNPGNGCFLQHDGSISRGAGGEWMINGTPIVPSNDYNVVITDYLANGNQDKMDFLKTENRRQGRKVKDILPAVTDYFARAYPALKEELNSGKSIPCY